MSLQSHTGMSQEHTGTIVSNTIIRLGPHRNIEEHDFAGIESNRVVNTTENRWSVGDRTDGGKASILALFCRPAEVPLRVLTRGRGLETRRRRLQSV
jgi:hypothetical protein